MADALAVGRLAQRPQPGRVHAHRRHPGCAAVVDAAPPRRRPRHVSPGADASPRLARRPRRPPSVPDLPSAPRGATLSRAHPGPAGLRLRRRPVARDPTARGRDHRGHRGADRRPGRGLHPGQAARATRPSGRKADAIALIDQYGVGRKGFDDGLAILYDLDDSKCHGQVQLYAAPGYRASYLTNEDRQAIYQDDMLPHLRACDMDGALDAALARIDAATTAERANQLQLARQVDAATGLILAPLALLGARRLGRLELAPLRPRPGVPRRSVGADARAATRPDACRRDRDAGRPGHPTCADHGARGPGRPGRAAVPAARRSCDRTTLDVLDPDRADSRVLRNSSVPLGAPEALVRDRLRASADGAGSLDADQLTELRPVDPGLRPPAG